MLKSKIINQSIRLLGRIWSWLTVEHAEYTATIFASVGEGNGPDGWDGSLFKGSDGRIFFGDLSYSKFDNPKIGEILPEDLSPEIRDALEGKWWNTDAPRFVSKIPRTKKIIETEVIMACQKAYSPSSFSKKRVGVSPVQLALI